ncbi:MAG TPA: hypothetical protein VFQ61_36560 [Polyangiaceae bacterium]|nr:hypothetical protein [Polyangiaceae bacterium]
MVSSLLNSRLGSATIALVASFVCALIVVAGASKWFPPGAAGLDQIVVPLSVFPIVWAAFVLVLHVAQHRARAWCFVAAITALHAVLIAKGLLSSS